MIVATNPVWAISAQAIGDVNAMLHEMQRMFAARMPDAAARPEALPMRMVGRTAVVSISGPMVNGPSWLSSYGYAVTGDIKRAVQLAAADSAISEIVLHINSPGGSVSGLSALSDEVAAASRIKSVRAGVDGMMASAALHVGVQARSVTAGRGDMVGSIGTYAVLYDTSALYEQAGVKPILISSGGLKGQGVDGLPISEELIADTQRIVDRYTADFKSAVAIGRRMTPQQVDALATGQVWIGSDAQAAGLVDSIESFDRMLAASQAQQAQIQRNRQRLALVDCQ